MSDNQDPLTMLQKIIEAPEGVEPVQNNTDNKQDQQVQSQEEIAAQEKRIAELKDKEAAKLLEDQAKIAQTREEFSQVIDDDFAQQEEAQDGISNQEDKKKPNQITQLKRLD
jgi:hypothetical protein